MELSTQLENPDALDFVAFLGQGNVQQLLRAGDLVLDP